MPKMGVLGGFSTDWREKPHYFPVFCCFALAFHGVLGYSAKRRGPFSGGKRELRARRLPIFIGRETQTEEEAN